MDKIAKMSILTTPPKKGQGMKSSIISTNLYMDEPNSSKNYNEEFLLLNIQYILQELEEKGYDINKKEVDNISLLHKVLIKKGYKSFVGILVNNRTSYAFVGNNIYKNGKHLYETVDAQTLN